MWETSKPHRLLAKIPMHIIYTDRHLHHDPAHAVIDGKVFDSEDTPERAETILRAIQKASIGQAYPPTDHHLSPILAVHDRGFVQYLRTAYTENTKAYGTPGAVLVQTFAPRNLRRKPNRFFGLPGYYSYGVGTPVLEGTWEAAYWSAQCALTAADAVVGGEHAAYALCRPPGHHAAADLFGGLCYLNNAAIVARYLQQRTPLPPTGEHWSEAKVAILDIDYHHGNGTQEIFYSDPKVLYCSLHAHPDDDYPYFWGAEDETGQGEGKSYNHNWPLPQGTTDADYLATLNEALAIIVDYRPHWFVISAGFDTLAGDSIGGFKLTLKGIGEIGKRIASLNLPTVIVQEGGYLLEKLGEAAVTFLKPFSSHDRD